MLTFELYVFYIQILHRTMPNRSTQLINFSTPVIEPPLRPIYYLYKTSRLALGITYHKQKNVSSIIIIPMSQAKLMKLKIAQAHRVPRSHSPANALLGRACQPPISDWQCEFREEVNICTVSCSQMQLAMPKAKSHVLSRHLLSL